MAILVVTGAAPGVGATVVTAAVAALALSRRATCAVVKPAQVGTVDGTPGDLDRVARLSGVAELHELTRYPDALSPAAAARRSGRAPLDLAACVELLLRLDNSQDLVLVLGSGGLLVRFDEDGLTLAEVARALRAPVLVVAAAGSGGFNAAALTLTALASRGVELSGLVVGAWPGAPTLEQCSDVRDLETLAARPLLGALEHGAGGLDRAEFLLAATRGLGPQLGGAFDARAFRRRAADVR